MKKLFVVSAFTVLMISNAFGAVKKDECFNSIAPVMKSIAKNFSTEMDMKVEFSTDFYEILHNGFFQSLGGIAEEEKKSERTYKVRLETEHSYDYWTVKVTLHPEFGSTGCMIRSLKSGL